MDIIGEDIPIQEEPVPPAVFSFWSELNKEQEEHLHRERLQVHQHLQEDDIQNPNTILIDEIKRREGNALLGYGESNHTGTGCLTHQNDLVYNLHKQFGVKCLFLEEESHMNQSLQEYLHTGKMSEELREYLIEGAIHRQGVPHRYKLELIEACQANGIPVQFIDNAVPDRDQNWVETIEKAIGKDVEGLYILIAGQNHILKDANIQRMDGRPFVSAGGLLEQQYPGKYISVSSITLDERYPQRPSTALETFIAEDLNALSRTQQSNAFQVEGSPYEYVQYLPSLNTTTGRSFDVIITHPGRLLDTDHFIEEEREKR